MWFTGDQVAARFINLAARPDRRKLMDDEFLPALGSVRAERFEAVARPQNGALGCTESHIAVLEECLKTDKPFFLVLEDDAQWEVDCADVFQRINAMPPPETVLCLSYYIPKVEICEDPENWGATVRARGIQTTTAYIVTRDFAEQTLLPCFRQSAEQLQKNEPPPRAALDVMWKQHQDKFRITMPRLVRQRIDRSDISPLRGGMPSDNGGGCVMLLLDTDSCGAPVFVPNLPFDAFRVPLQGSSVQETLKWFVMTSGYANVSLVYCTRQTTGFQKDALFRFIQESTNPWQQPIMLMGAAATNAADSNVEWDFAMHRNLVRELVQGFSVSDNELTRVLPQICAKKRWRWHRTAINQNQHHQ